MPDGSLFLGAFEVVSSSELASDELLLRTRYTGPSLGELTERKLLIRRDGGELLLRATPSYPAAAGTVTEQERRCSFVVDCDDEAVEALLAELRAQQRGSVSDVVDYVHAFISAKRLTRRFDIASVVARSREGDCTEHAALTAALLRGIGVPARIVLGMVLLEAGGRRMAYGHAWTEHHDGTRWALADATKLDATADRTFYLPLQTLREEGAGFARALLDGLQPVDVEAMVVPRAP